MYLPPLQEHKQFSRCCLKKHALNLAHLSVEAEAVYQRRNIQHLVSMSKEAPDFQT